MTLWFVFALMTAAAIFAVLWPLGRQRREQRSGSDLAVYRDQLDEVARDRTSGLIGEAEAEAARVEVSRRLIAAADAAPPEVTSGVGETFRRRAAAALVLVALPAIAAALYLTLGSPQLPGQPLASRAATPLQDRTLDTLVAQVEDHLAKNPEDGRGWEVVGPVYMRLGRFEDAVKARRNALRINGSSADREADLGESLMAAANGVVTDEAKAAFERALVADTKNPKARFFLGVAAYQDGQGASAAAIWRDMLKDARPDSPWVGTVREALASVGTASDAPGPSADDVAAAQQMTTEDRDAMVRGMVDRLAERLKRDGSDVEGWLRLVRAYTVLGDRDRALSAIADARRALGHDTDKLRRLDALVKELRLES
ncbi:MAG: cytochrome c-type biosis protein CcmH [Hyphomicrobiales bacterium]|jgi:cytochrome c-type biogenesis protein CcmH|nr:cytochrome c-type biosis protein CcmH [Hyphomicrobiales bacterium]